MKHPTWFSGFAREGARLAGHPFSFVVATVLVLIWLVTGPLFRFSDAWQLVINTLTNIVTLLMVFLLQNSQNRDTEAMQVKLDELIRATREAHNALLDTENMDEETLDQFRSRYSALAQEARNKVTHGKPDKGSPETHP